MPYTQSAHRKKHSFYLWYFIKWLLVKTFTAHRRHQFIWSYRWMLFGYYGNKILSCDLYCVTN